jgi:hypothetical protein
VPVSPPPPEAVLFPLPPELPPSPELGLHAASERRQMDEKKANPWSPRWPRAVFEKLIVSEWYQ